MSLQKILVLAMTTADDGVGRSYSVLTSCCSFFVVLQTNWCFLGSLKAKQLILVSKIILTDPYVTSRDLHGRKLYKFRVQVSLSHLCSTRTLSSTQRNRFTQTLLSKVCSMYWQKYKSSLIQLLTFKHPERLDQLALPNSKTQFQLFTFDILY